MLLPKDHSHHLILNDGSYEPIAIENLPDQEKCLPLAIGGVV